MTPEDLREQIPATNDVAYFNTGASGPHTRRVLDAMAECQREHGVESPAGDGMGMYAYAGDVHADARAAAAEFVGADEGEIGLVPSTTDGVNVVADGLDWNEGDVVVKTDLEHPAGFLPWRRLRDRWGIEVRTLETDHGRLDLDDVADAVEDAKLLCLSSISWNFGTRLPIEEITEIAHDAGTLVLVDAVQSVGQEPIDVDDWDVDFLAGASHKWLLGPWGAGFLYVDGEVLDRLRPGRVGARSVVDPNGDGLEYEPTASRIELSTMAVAPYAGLIAGIETIEDVGFETLRGEIERLTDRLKAATDRPLLSPKHYESGLVSFSANDPNALVERLGEEGIVIRSIPDPGCVRASVHAFNTDEEIDALAEALSQ